MSSHLHDRRGSRHSADYPDPHGFQEPDLAPSQALQLRTTGQSIDDFPSKNALATIEDPDKLQRQLSRAPTKVVRRGGKASSTGSGSDIPTNEQSKQVEERLFIKLSRNLADNTVETSSFIRENPNKGEEDYRHKRLVRDNDSVPHSGKRAKTGRGRGRKTSPADPTSPLEPKSGRNRARRSTRPAVFEYDVLPNEEEGNDDYGVKNESTSENEYINTATNSKYAKQKRKLEKEHHNIHKSDLEDTEETVKEESEVESEKQEISSTEIPKHPAIINNDYCAACGGTGELLCCETCVRSFHFSCIEPPVMKVDEIEEELWTCRKCSPRRIADSQEREDVAKTLFGPVILQLESHNAVSYQMPAHIRETFANIQVSKYGECLDEFHKSEPPATGPRIQDKAGNTLLCFKCQGSGIHEPLAVCSKCQTPWHVDCVNPPLESTPLGYWECPLHAGHTLELPKRVNKPVLMPVTLRRNIPNNGDIEVKDDEDESSQEGLESVDDENGDRTHKKPKRGSKKHERVSAGSFTDEETAKYIQFPAQTRMQPDGSIVAKTQRSRPRGYEAGRVVYNITPRTIKLDFLDAVYRRRVESYKQTPVSDIMVALDVLASRPQPECEAVRNLMALKLQGPAVDTARAKENLNTLIDAALNDENELGQMVAIRKLMQEKGKERLIRILQES